MVVQWRLSSPNSLVSRVLSDSRVRNKLEESRGLRVFSDAKDRNDDVKCTDSACKLKRRICTEQDGDVIVAEKIKGSFVEVGQY